MMLFFLVEGMIISAKPQIRNIRAEVTKLIPTALRIRRDDGKHKSKKPALNPTSEPSTAGAPSAVSEEPTKDDVYKNFMREMEGFL